MDSRCTPAGVSRTQRLVLQRNKAILWLGAGPKPRSINWWRQARQLLVSSGLLGCAAEAIGCAATAARTRLKDRGIDQLLDVAQRRIE